MTLKDRLDACLICIARLDLRNLEITGLPFTLY